MHTFCQHPLCATISCYACRPDTSARHTSRWVEKGRVLEVFPWTAAWPPLFRARLAQLATRRILFGYIVRIWNLNLRDDTDVLYLCIYVCVYVLYMYEYIIYISTVWLQLFLACTERSSGRWRLWRYRCWWWSCIHRRTCPHLSERLRHPPWEYCRPCEGTETSSLSAQSNAERNNHVGRRVGQRCYKHDSAMPLLHIGPSSYAKGQEVTFKWQKAKSPSLNLHLNSTVPSGHPQLLCFFQAFRARRCIGVDFWYEKWRMGKPYR